jgi:hypothetical protein
VLCGRDAEEYRPSAMTLRRVLLAVGPSPDALRYRRVGLWSVDDPAFVGRRAIFVADASALEFVASLSDPQGSSWDAAAKPFEPRGPPS